MRRTLKTKPKASESRNKVILLVIVIPFILLNLIVGFIRKPINSHEILLHMANNELCKDANLGGYSRDETKINYLVGSFYVTQAFDLKSSKTYECGFYRIFNILPEIKTAPRYNGMMVYGKK
jgi:hypothetical protein